MREFYFAADAYDGDRQVGTVASVLEIKIKMDFQGLQFTKEKLLELFNSKTPDKATSVRITFWSLLEA